MKACNDCGKSKPESEFYRNPKAADGLAGKCKDCAKAASKANRLANIDKIRERDRVRHQANKERRCEQMRDYWRTPEGRAKREAAQRAWRERNREKVRAHSAVARALKSGKLVKPLDCEGCGPAYSGKLEAHHDDYSKPLEVKFLCDCCHKKRHIELRLEVRPMQAKRWKITDPELLGEDEPETIEPEEPAPDPHYSDVPF